MRQVLLSPRWLVRHAVAAALVAAFLLLGWWQWREAVGGGTARNVAYALEWPLFASFVVFLWWRTLRLELRTRAGNAPSGAPDEPRSDGTASGPARAPELTVPVRRWSRPSTTLVTGPDEALAAYNRYLAQLDSATPAQVDAAAPDQPTPRPDRQEKST